MARLKIKPLDDYVVIKQHEAKEITDGGIVLPEQAKEKPTTGTVLAVGPGKLQSNPIIQEQGIGPLRPLLPVRWPLSVKVGDEVFYSKYSGTDVEIDGKECSVLRESDILAVIEK